MQNRHHITAKFHIRKGDTVQVLSGNDKQKKGLIIKVFPKAYRAIVAGIQLVLKHKKPTAHNPKGGIIRVEAPVHMSNLMLVDPATGKPTRVGHKLNSEGKLQRYSKETGGFIKNE
jgi:large subunit ribosomal protein L24